MNSEVQRAILSAYSAKLIGGHFIIQMDNDYSTLLKELKIFEGKDMEYSTMLKSVP